MMSNPTRTPTQIRNRIQNQTQNRIRNSALRTKEYKILHYNPRRHSAEERQRNIHARRQHGLPQVLLLFRFGVVVILIVIDEGEIILIGEEIHSLILQKIIIFAEIGVGVSTKIFSGILPFL